MNTQLPFQSQKPIFNKVGNIADICRLQPSELDNYHISLDSYRTSLAVMEHERNKGRAEGRAEGLSEGRAEGVLSVARNMLAMGLPTESIAQATGLSVDEILML